MENETTKKKSDEAKLKGTEGILLKVLFALTIVGIPLASVIVLRWAVNQ